MLSDIDAVWAAGAAMLRAGAHSCIGASQLGAALMTATDAVELLEEAADRLIAAEGRLLEACKKLPGATALGDELGASAICMTLSDWAVVLQEGLSLVLYAMVADGIRALPE